MSKKKWTKKVMETSNAMDIREGLFKGSAKEIARDLKKAACESNRTKGTKFSSAMSMLNFYINRGGSNLPDDRKQVLEQAKQELRKEFKQFGESERKST